MANVTDWKKSDARMAKDWLGMAKRDVSENATPANRKELQKMQALSNTTDAAYKDQLARDARVGAGRGEVNPDADGKKRGGAIKGYAKGGRVTGYKGYGKAKKV